MKPNVAELSILYSHEAHRDHEVFIMIKISLWTLCLCGDICKNFVYTYSVLVY